MLSVYMAVRVRPLPRLPPLELKGCGPFDADIAGVEREGVAALHAVPLERFQVELGHDGVAVVRVEDVDVLRAEPGAFVHPARPRGQSTSRFRPGPPACCAA